MPSCLRRLALLGLLTLTACESAGPGFQPLPLALRVEGEVQSRWHQVPLLDPRTGPVEVLGRMTGHVQALVAVRRRVPAGVPAPCLALRNDTLVALDRDRWLFGVQTEDGIEVLPCIYDLVLARNDESVTAYSRYPDTKNDTWMPVDSALEYSNGGKWHVAVGEAVGAWFDDMPIGVQVEPGVPRARNRFRFRNVPGSQAVELGDRSWPWHVSSEGRAIDGISSSDLYASFLRHDDGVLFAARGPNGRDWAVWKLAPSTGAVQQLTDSRYVFAWPPPSQRDWRSRMGHDEQTKYSSVKPYVARPSPNDPSLLWLRRQTGEYEPPPGTAGVVPLVTFPPKYKTVSQIAGLNDLQDQRLVPANYVRRVEQFLVAYDTEAGRMWGTASNDFATLSGPLYSQVLLRRSTALTTRVGYEVDAMGAAEWVLVQRASDGAWAVGHGFVPEDSRFRVGVEPDHLVAAAEQEVDREQAPLVHNAEVAKVLDANMQELRRLAAEGQRARERAEAMGIYTWAMQNGSNVYGWSSATQLGGQELVDFALRMGTLSQCEQVLARSEWSESQRASLTQHVEGMRQQKAAEEAARVADAQRQSASAGGGGGGGGIDWNGWRRETMNAQSANQLGLTGEAFQNYMQRHR